MGDLDVVITHHGQKVHTEREALGDGRFRYTFVPGETGHYEVKATFNNDSIPGEEYLAVAVSPVPKFAVSPVPKFTVSPVPKWLFQVKHTLL